MNITITINTDNAAFDKNYPEFEIIRILDKLTTKLEINGLIDYPLLDLNGGKVGAITIKES